MAAEALSDSDFQEASAATGTSALTDADFQQPAAATMGSLPIPRGTSYLQDKDMVVGHPLDMSHDQVNDAVQTNIYGRPRNDFHEDAPPVDPSLLNRFMKFAVVSPDTTQETASWPETKALLAETGKGAIRGIENVGMGLGGLFKWLGESFNTTSDKEDYVSRMSEVMASKSQDVVDWLKKRQESGFEAPDPEIFRGSFVSNPSFTRLAASVAQGAPVLGAATALTLATGDPLAGAGMLGLVSGGEQYEASREHGQTPEQAGAVATASGIGNALLMSLPIGQALEGFGAAGLESMAKGAAEFSGISAIMTPFNNIVARIGGDKARGLFDGMAESILSGAVSGGILGALTPGRGAEIDALIQEAHKAGVPAKDIDAARSEIAKQMVENPEAVTRAVEATASTSSRPLEAQPTAQEASNPQRTEPVLPEFLGTRKPSEELLRTIFPWTEVSSDPSIADHPDFKRLTSDASAVVTHYAAVRGEKPTAEFADNLFHEMHDAYNEIIKSPVEKKVSVAAAVLAKYPDIQNEFTTLRDKLWTDTNEHWFGRNVEKKYGSMRPRFALEAEKEPPAEIIRSMKEVKRGDSGTPAENKYVLNRPFEFDLGENDKSTSKGIREEFSGQKNEQISRGSQLAEEIRRLVPDKTERQGMFWYKAADGDLNVLADALSDPKLAAYHDQIKKALDLSPKAIEALQKINQYYTEAGSVSQEIGTIGNVRENYQNRIYAPDKPQDFVKTEMNSGIRQSTRHAKQRIFDTEFDAARAGKTFATTDVADSLSIHNEEMARVNTSRKMGEALADNGLGAWKKEQPDGWEQVGNLQKRVPIKDEAGNAVIGEDGNQVFSQSKFYAPKGIAKGLAAIAEPNITKKIDSLRNIQRYQGLVKTVDLSFSFFHHFTMAMQMAYQGGIRSLLSLPSMNESLSSPMFKDVELDFIRHTGITAKVSDNQDIFRNLVQNNGDTFSKITNLPVAKQTLQAADASSEFLFGKVQRWMKVTDYGRKMANWVADHPEATNAEVKDAKIGFAKEINAAYGGLNWEAMGMTKSNLSLLRLGLLAPDWTISNYQLLSYAIGDSGTAGQSSRAHILTALIGGMALTEGLNKMLTGHFTDQNKEGHRLEVEISPNVYVSLLRGGIGDITKAASMVSESGLAGASRFLQGKLAPFPRTAIGLLNNVQYTGRPIAKRGEGPVANSYDVLKYLLSSLAPMPLGVSNFLQYMANEHDKTASGSGAVLSGIGRYSRSGRNSSKLRM